MQFWSVSVLSPWLLSQQVSLPFPEEGLVYDYVLDDAGISLPAMDEDDEEELKKREVRKQLISACYRGCVCIVSRVAGCLGVRACVWSHTYASVARMLLVPSNDVLSVMCAGAVAELDAQHAPVQHHVGHEVLGHHRADHGHRALRLHPREAPHQQQNGTDADPSSICSVHCAQASFKDTNSLRLHICFLVPAVNGL